MKLSMTKKTFRASRGRCTCGTIEKMKECLHYAPWDNPWQPEMCMWINEWDGRICQKEGSTGNLKRSQ